MLGQVLWKVMILSQLCV